MKILKAGRPQKGWSKEYTCTGDGNGGGGCRARLLVEQADVYCVHSTDYSGHTDTYNTFKCAGCGVETDIKGSLPFDPPRKRVGGRSYDNGEK